MAITFDRVNKFVIPDTDIVTIQALYNAIRNYEDEPDNLDLDIMVRASGKDELGGGVQTGITMTLLDGWTIRWNPRVAASPEFIIRRVTGGNLAESGGVIPITPSDGNTIVVQSSSSATILNQEELSFGGAVWLDVISGAAGTAYPLGTERFPSNNLADSVIIAASRNIRRFEIRGPLTYNVALSGYEFDGFGGGGIITVVAPADLQGTFWEDMIFTGANDFGVTVTSPAPALIKVRESIFSTGSLAGFEGEIARSNFIDWTIIPEAGARTIVSECNGGGVGITPNLTIDCVNGPVKVELRDYTGTVKFINVTDPAAELNVDMPAGMILFDSSSTANPTNTMHIHGAGHLIDFGSAIVPNIHGLTIGRDSQQLRQLQGLDPALPLVVDLSTGVERRYVGLGSPAEIEQTILKAGLVTTVTRTK